MLLFSVLWVLFIVVKCKAESVPYTSPILPKRNNTNSLNFQGIEFYYETTLKVNFFQAHRLCKLYGMDLLYVDTFDENERLGIFATQIGYGHDHFWTSGNNLHDFQEWSWLSNGKLFRYTNWYPGEPNLGASGSDTNERCVEIRTLDKGGFSWNNVPCERLYYFICKKNKNSCVYK
ncbi:perlucin-like [Diabrotica undecimpunctata]|uniref:perlucin-like n=1 Tax=Diabrotica undecimpunctata TaxID=50387 RepID=UPI003B641EA2